MTELNSVILAPERTLMMVVDIQNETSTPGGIRYSEKIGALVPRIKLLLDRARKNQVPIIFSHSVRNQRETAVTVFNYDHTLQEGTWDAEIPAGLLPRHDDIHVYKYTHDVWWQTDLEKRIENMGYEPADTNVIVTGIASVGCVNFAVKGLHLRNFWTFVAYDCMDENPWAQRHYALEDFYNVFPTRSDLINFGSTLVENDT